MFSSSGLSICWLMCLALCGCSYPSDISVATQADAAPMEPVSVTAVQNPPPHDSKEDERNHADEVLAVALAQARAFSPRVLGLQESISRSVQQQFANQVLTDRRSIEIRRSNTRWRPRGPFASSILGKDSSGSYAGDEYLASQKQKLANQLEDLVTRFETALQEETWLRLSVQDQTMIAEHDLIPLSIRETALENSQALMRHLKKMPEEPAKVPPLGEWVVTKISGTAYEIAFPSVPTITVADISTTYTAQHGGRTFIVEFSPNVEVPEDLLPHNIPLTLAQNNVAELEQQGSFGAVRTSTLADLSAAELCVYYLAGDRVKRERASYCRYAMLGRDFIAVNTNDARIEDPYTERFFESFRHLGDAP